MTWLEQVKQSSKPTNYAPIWLSIIHKRGMYRISEQSVKDEERSCRGLSGISFYEWLTANNFKIKGPSENHYTIYR